MTVSKQKVYGKLCFVDTVDCCIRHANLLVTLLILLISNQIGASYIEPLCLTKAPKLVIPCHETKKHQYMNTT